MPPYKKALANIRLPAIRLQSKQIEMGCASSHAADIQAQLTTNTDRLPTPKSLPDIKEPQEENDEKTTTNKLEPPKYPPAEAFEIPLNPDNIDQQYDSSLIKKHPPKRLQRLVEQSQQQNDMATSATTIENLEEKLAKAELRRQKFLKQRVNTALALGQSEQLSLSSSTSMKNNKDETNNIDILIVNDDNNNEESINQIESNNNINDIEVVESELKNVENNEKDHKNIQQNENDVGNQINYSNLRDYVAPTVADINSNVTRAQISVNNDDKYRSPGDGDENKETLENGILA